MQLITAFSRVKSGYKQNDVNSLTTAELRSMGKLACGISATDIARIDPAVFWYDKCLTSSEYQIVAAQHIFIRPPDIVCRRTYILPVFLLLLFFAA